MALTKVRSPVTAIDNLANGTTSVDIASAGADIISTVSGTTVLTLAPTGLTVGTGLTTVTDILDSETINLATTSGAEATLGTTLSQLEIGTTSAHPVEISANSIAALTVATDGKVTLGVEGTAVGHLITKAYADGVGTASVALADMPATIATTGSLTLPNASGTDLILKWGITGSIGATTQAVTFGTAYPNAMFGASVALVTASGSGDNNLSYGNAATTGFDIVKNNSASHPVFWIAIGY